MSGLISLGRGYESAHSSGLSWWASAGVVEVIAEEALQRVGNSVSQEMRDSLGGWPRYQILDNKPLDDIRLFRRAMRGYVQDIIEMGPEKFPYDYDYFALSDIGLCRLIEITDERLARNCPLLTVPRCDFKELTDWFSNLIHESCDRTPLLLDGRYMSARRRHFVRRALLRVSGELRFPTIRTIWMMRYDAKIGETISLFERFGPLAGMRRRSDWHYRLRKRREALARQARESSPPVSEPQPPKKRRMSFLWRLLRFCLMHERAS